MSTHDLSFLENDCTYENSIYECPARNLFGQASSSQADTIVLETRKSVDENQNTDSAQKIDPNLLSGMDGTPKRKEHGVTPKPIERGATPQMGPFQTFVAAGSTCAILCRDTPVQSNPRDIRKRAPEAPEQAETDGKKVRRKKPTTGVTDPKPKEKAKSKAIP